MTRVAESIALPRQLSILLDRLGTCKGWHNSLRDLPLSLHFGHRRDLHSVMAVHIMNNATNFYLMHINYSEEGNPLRER
jgi:hypothetical protein